MKPERNPHLGLLLPGRVARYPYVPGEISGIRTRHSQYERELVFAAAGNRT